MTAPPSERARLDPRRVENLKRRAAALSVVRRFFSDEGFLEIEAPLLVPSPGLEVHLDAFTVGPGGPGGAGQGPAELFLITSPEYQLKRLLAGGLDRIVSVAKCFRRGEAGPHHNPEFTMIEWYRANEGWERIADDVERLCARVVRSLAARRGPHAASHTGDAASHTGDAAAHTDDAASHTGDAASHTGDAAAHTYQGHAIDLSPPWERLSVREAMRRYAGLELAFDEPTDALVEKARAAGHRIGPGTERWDDAFFTVFLDAVEPRLGRGRPTILHDWPAPLCALARKKPGDENVVERFEAYAAGLELCNGFGELTDAVEQRARLLADREERRRRGLPLYPIDERFLAALAEGMPPSGGVALGFDRLVMLACDARSIREVTAFTVDEL